MTGARAATAASDYEALKSEMLDELNAASGGAPVEHEPRGVRVRSQSPRGAQHHHHQMNNNYMVKSTNEVLDEMRNSAAAGGDDKGFILNGVGAAQMPANMDGMGFASSL